jgi:predicted ATP-grasp superfamily ATP-dependent carboligase
MAANLTEADSISAAAARRVTPLRILLSEGSSTSGREAVTVLGAMGHRVDVCDPDPHCISRFSRFVNRFHRCPALATDPEGYVSFMLDLVSREAFDALLPIHEQGLALARVHGALARRVAVALPAFEAYERVLSKVGFSDILSELGLPQPRTRLVDSVQQVREIDEFPIVLKTAIGTASRGVWIVRNAEELDLAIVELEREAAPDNPILAQEFVDGPVEHAQAVFDDGRLIGMHAFRQIERGAGGGDALKQSVSRPRVQADLARLGGALDWHGALSVDYLLRNGEPVYIDCNPRLVEPMSGTLAGNDLLTLLIQVTMKQKPQQSLGHSEGVRTHLALQALLGCAARTRSRLELARECWRLAAGAGRYAGSQEELTPLRWDWPSVIPLWGAAVWLAIKPAAAQDMHRKGWGRHLLNPESIRRIRNLTVEPT